MKKILVVTLTFPPRYAGGSSMFLRNLFKHFNLNSYCVLMKAKDSAEEVDDPKLNLGCKIYLVKFPKFLKQFDLKINFSILIEYILIPYIVFKILRIIRTERPDSILANFPSGSFLIASWLAHKISGIELYVYLHSSYYTSRVAPIERFFAKALEAKIIRSAKKVFVATPALKELYDRLYNINAIVIEHSIDFSEAPPIDTEKIPVKKAEYNIVFTGSIYSMNQDALRDLIKAVGLIKDRRLKLTFVSPITKKRLRELRLEAPFVEVFLADRDKTLTLQRSADILCLPLSFNSPYPVEIDTVLPMKLMDYLISGRPVLLYAPKNCYTSHYAKDHGFAFVVDEKDPIRLSEAIKTLLDSPDIIFDLIRNARHTALLHDSKKISKKFQDYLFN